MGFLRNKIQGRKKRFNEGKTTPLTPAVLFQDEGNFFSKWKRDLVSVHKNKTCMGGQQAA